MQVSSGVQGNIYLDFQIISYHIIHIEDKHDDG